MGNNSMSTIFDNNEKYTDNYTELKDTKVNKIRKEYKVIDVDWLDVQFICFSRGKFIFK